MHGVSVIRKMAVLRNLVKHKKVLFRIGAHSPCKVSNHRIVLLLPSRILVLPLEHMYSSFFMFFSELFRKRTPAFSMIQQKNQIHLEARFTQSQF
jgi:hypothetical protein